jgi:hypothetical protein
MSLVGISHYQARENYLPLMTRTRALGRVHVSAPTGDAPRYGPKNPGVRSAPVNAIVCGGRNPDKWRRNSANEQFFTLLLGGRCFRQRLVHTHDQRLSGFAPTGYVDLSRDALRFHRVACVSHHHDNQVSHSHSFPDGGAGSVALAQFGVVGRIHVGSGKLVEAETVASGGHFSRLAVPCFLSFSGFHSLPKKPAPVITTGH